jgi:hypothetical protein
MSARDKIYTFRLATDKSNKFFDFIIIPASTDVLDWETCEKEEISSLGIIKDKLEIESNFTEKFLNSIASADFSQINFNLKYCSSDFQSVLYSPTVATKITIGTTAVNRVNLLVINKVAQIPEGQSYREEYECMGLFAQDLTMETETIVSHSGIVMEAKFINLAKYILENIQSSVIATIIRALPLNPSSALRMSAHFLIDFLFNYKNAGNQNIKHLLCGRYNEGNADGFVSTNRPIVFALWLIDFYIIYYANYLYSILSRQATAYTGFCSMVNNPFIALTYYKINYYDNWTMNKGTALNYTQLYLQDEFLVEDYAGGLYDMETAWDYWASCCENNICKLIFDYDVELTNAYAIPTINFRFMQIYEENTAITKPEFLFSNIEGSEFKLAKGELKIRSVETNLNLGDSTIDNITKIDGGSLSKEQFECKSIFNTCREMYPKDAIVINSLSSSSYPYRDACRIVSKEIFVSKLYYLNTGLLNSEYGNWGEPYNVIMVHPFVKINVDTTNYYESSGAVTIPYYQEYTKDYLLQHAFAMLGYHTWYDVYLKNSVNLLLFNKDYVILECTLHRGEKLYDHHYYPRHIGDKIPITVPTFLAWFEEYEKYNDLISYLKTKTGYIYLTELKYNLINNNLSVKFIWE